MSVREEIEMEASGEIDMTTTIRRILSSCFVVCVTAAGIAPAPAQAQYGQQRLAEGSHFWGEDGWCYIIQGGRPVRSNHYRVFPDPRNRSVYTIYENGRFSRRVVEPTVNPQPNAEAQLQGLVNQLNQLTAAAPRAAQPTMMPGCPAFSGPLMAPNVRQNIPMAPQCMTAEEKRWSNQFAADLMTRQTLENMQKNCENRRDSQPYTHKYTGPDGVTVYRMRDGSERREGSNLNPGWNSGFSGPMMTTCR
jgi:hypothetical protein